MSLGIYFILNIETDKIYVGSSKHLEDRWKEHLSLLRNNKHPNRHLQFAWNKYGEESFKFEIIEEVASISSLIKREQYFIDLYETYNDKYGYNLRPKAESNLGIKWGPLSAETKQKLRKKMLGRKLSPEWVQKIIKAKKGKPSKLKGKLIILRETRVCICGCNESFECKTNSDQKFIHGHNSIGNKNVLGKVSPMKGKTLEEIYGAERAITVREHFSESHMGQKSHLGHLKERTEYICEKCGIKFYRLPSNSHRKIYRFCSLKCSTGCRITKVSVVCLNCKNTFLVQKNRLGKALFCNNVCYFDFRYNRVSKEVV